MNKFMKKGLANAHKTTAINYKMAVKENRFPEGFRSPSGCLFCQVTKPPQPTLWKMDCEKCTMGNVGLAGCSYMQTMQYIDKFCPDDGFEMNVLRKSDITNNIKLKEAFLLRAKFHKRASGMVLRSKTLLEAKQKLIKLDKKLYNEN